MSETVQNIKCGWIGCGHKFGSEIDMNMHVMMNHMCLFEHGNYVLNRGAPKRKRPLEVVRELSPEITEIQAPPRLMASVKMEPNPSSAADFAASSSTREAPVQNPESSRLVPPPQKAPRIVMAEPSNRLLENMRPPGEQRLQAPNSSIIQQLQHFPAAPTPPPPNVPVRNDGDSDGSIQNGDDQAQLDAQNHLNMLMANPPRLSDIIDEFLERLRPMKQLGFIRPQRPVYCVVCLKYVRSFHECNWKHTPGEERVAEMWYRRFQKARPDGKAMLVKELEELKELILHEEMEEDAKTLADKH